MKQISLIGFVMLMSGSIWAGGNGGSAGSFLTLPAGARSASLGEGDLAATEDASALHINPASMAGLERASVVGTHVAYIDSSFYDNVSYVNPRSSLGAWGVGFQYFSAGSVEKTDGEGSPSGNFTPNDLAVTGGYAKALGPVKGGIGLKYVNSTLVKSATTVTLDLGIESKTLLGDRLALGVVGQNLIGSLKYDQESNPLPRTIKGGAGYNVMKNWTVVADAFFPKGADSFYSVGTEYWFKFGEPWGVALRGGYNTRTKDVNGFSDFSMGLGVEHNSLKVDYAFLPFGDIGSTHWFTLGWGF